ncbi:MAG: acetyltransferase [Desulforhopalus sp.]|nr:acetyltransferase [Desulforhopalus sp.]
MKSPLIIFGIGDVAQLAHFYFTTDTDYEVVAFTLDAAYIKDTTFCNLPVVAFEEISKHYSPKNYEIFVALGYSKLNAVRKEKYLAAKSLGFRIATYISPHATVLNQGYIGENCFILENCIIQPFVVIGNNVTLWSGGHIGHHSIIRDHCFIAPQVAVSGGVDIGQQCFLGVNATLRNHIKIGEKCVIGAGTLLLTDTEPGGVYIGTSTERSEISSTNLRSI